MAEIMQKRCKIKYSKYILLVYYYCFRKLNLNLMRNDKRIRYEHILCFTLCTCNHLNRAIKIDWCFKTHLCTIPYWSYYNSQVLNYRTLTAGITQQKTVNFILIVIASLKFQRNKWKKLKKALTNNLFSFLTNREKMNISTVDCV